MAEIYIGDQQISGGGSGGGETFDPSYLETGLLDVSTRVDALEQIDYVETNDISAFVTQSAFDSSYVALDTSIKALDASALAFDASIKELTEGGGGGGSDWTEPVNSGFKTKSSKINIWYTKQNQTGLYKVYLEGKDSSCYFTDNSTNFGRILTENSFRYPSYVYGTISSTYPYGNYYLSKNFIFANEANVKNAHLGVAIGDRPCCYGNNSVYIGTCNNSAYGALNDNAVCIGKDCYTDKIGSICIGCNLENHKSWSECFGYYNKIYQQGRDAYGAHAEGYYNNITISVKDYGYGAHVEGYCNIIASKGEHGEGVYNLCSSVNDNTFGTSLKTLSTIGNGAADSSRHNAFEVRQSGDIYIPDVSASGEYYEKPMINLQQKIYELEARIAVLESAIQTK